MKRSHTRALATLAAGVVSLTASACSIGSGGSAASGNFPSEEITLLVPYQAGGPTDLTARAVAKVLEKELGEAVVVENKPGGSGATATQQLITSPPDGHTIALITAGTVVLTPLANDVGYTHEDITPLGMLSEVPSLIAVGKNSPYKNADEFFKAAKKNPGKLNVAVPGASTMQGVELQRLEKEYGVKVTAVPFDSSAEMTTALLGGNVDAAFVSLAKDVVQFIDDGQMVPLAVSPEERLPWLPDVPTLREVGFEKLTLSGSTYGVAAPKDVSKHIVTKYEDALEVANKNSELIRTVGENYIRKKFCDADCLTALLDETKTTYEPVLAE
ncbi:Bug family tripartite tricarboxylate transporter substrate binding protein [Prauserella flavalba]|uniref:Bug family tripartite tricarboxylate transporter substrate binding protein n=1 Tax=Prauserella flavalba TaxID=1477506 RepID=UPI0036E41DE9